MQRQEKNNPCLTCLCACVPVCPHNLGGPPTGRQHMRLTGVFSLLGACLVPRTMRRKPKHAQGKTHNTTLNSFNWYLDSSCNATHRSWSLLSPRHNATAKALETETCKVHNAEYHHPTQRHPGIAGDIGNPNMGWIQAQFSVKRSSLCDFAPQETLSATHPISSGE